MEKRKPKKQLFHPEGAQKCIQWFMDLTSKCKIQKFSREKNFFCEWKNHEEDFVFSSSLELILGQKFNGSDSSSILRGVLEWVVATLALHDANVISKESAFDGYLKNCWRMTWWGILVRGVVS